MIKKRLFVTANIVRILCAGEKERFEVWFSYAREKREEAKSPENFKPYQDEVDTFRKAALEFAKSAVDSGLHEEALFYKYGKETYWSKINFERNPDVILCRMTFDNASAVNDFAWKWGNPMATGIWVNWTGYTQILQKNRG